MSVSASSLKKVIFLILFLVLAGIWANNLYQLVPKWQEAPFRLKDDRSEGSAASKVSGPSRIPLAAYPQDPFQPFFKRVEEAPPLKIEKVEPEIIPPRLHFLGLVKGGKGKQALVGLEGGATEIVAAKDELWGVTIIGFDEEILKYKFKGKVVAESLGRY
jgi:hypothetical protein